MKFKGIYEILDNEKVILKNWFEEGDLEISSIYLTNFGKRKK